MLAVLVALFVTLLLVFQMRGVTIGQEITDTIILAIRTTSGADHGSSAAIQGQPSHMAATTAFPGFSTAATSIPTTAQITDDAASTGLPLAALTLSGVALSGGFATALARRSTSNQVVQIRYRYHPTTPFLQCAKATGT